MLVKKINRFLININSLDDIKEYKKVGITTFVFALNDYAIGYEKYFSVDEINGINETKYVIINRLLDTEDIENIKNVLKELKVDGFIFEDIGLIKVFNELNIPGKKILYMNHFNNNSMSINYWLDYVDSVFVGNELTYDEYKVITEKVKKDIVLNVFGYNQVMYSKRLLLSNFYKKYNLDIKKKGTIKDQNSDIMYHINEEDDGTIFYSNKIFNGKRLLDLDNSYYYINSSFIDKDVIMKFLENEDIDSDEGFLDKKTIYKLKEKEK